MTGFNDLIEGYRRFRATDWQRERARWAELAEGQRPRIMIIACSDSRSEPSRIFDTAPGEIFTVRNIANLVPPYEPDSAHHGVSAALEFAVTQLEIEEVIVLGHGFCGGCAAALTRQFEDARPGEGGFIDHWVDILDEARDKVLATHSKPLGRAAFLQMEYESVRISLRNLREFPWVRDREKTGKLKLRGAFFAIADGILSLLDEHSGKFDPA